MPQLPLGPGQASWLLCSASPGLIRKQVHWHHRVTVQATLGRHSTSDCQILTQYKNLLGLKYLFGLQGLISGVTGERVHPCPGSDQAKREEKVMDLPQGLGQPVYTPGPADLKLF